MILAYQSSSAVAALAEVKQEEGPIRQWVLHSVAPSEEKLVSDLPVKLNDVESAIGFID